MVNGTSNSGPLELALGHLDPLQTTAGYHDFHSIRIMGGHEGEALVAFHELVHDEMLRQTPYGSILIVLRLVHRHPKSPQAKAAAESWLLALVQASRRSQECAATYLSIKNFHPREHSRLLNTLPALYKDYFEGLARYLDPIFESSYVQYLVGKAIIQAVLSSPLSVRLREWSPDLAVSISAEEAPDQRMDFLLQALGSKFGQLKAVLADHIWTDITLPRDFDIHSERSWSEIPHQTRSALEGQIVAKIRLWLFPLAGEILSWISPEQWTNVMTELWNQVLSRYAKVDEIASLPRQSAEADVFVPQITIETGSRFEERGFPLLSEHSNLMSIFTEMPDREFSVVPRGASLGPSSALEVGPFKVFITASPASNQMQEPSWYRFTSDGTAILHGDKIVHALLKRGLRARTAIASLGSPIPTVDALIVGLHNDDLAAAQRLIDDLISCHQIGSRGGLVDTKEIIWYMSGNVMAWYDALVSTGETEVLWYYPNLPAFQTSQSPTDFEISTESGVIWLVMRRPSAPGIFFRVVVWVAAHPLLTAAESDLKKGRVRLIPKDQGNQIADQLAKAFQAMQFTWSEV